ncbi:MAG: hypothetical protein P4K93_08470 [Terracidiphilus sp.]|nr:hypothetical protein [Terracidiphilus sp.]MDR3798171.1 hypothetical protein [Terracidiphilus sp.]
MNRREFCCSLLALSNAAAARRLWAAENNSPRIAPAVWDSSKSIHFVLNDLLDHPFYWWPRTLLTYPIEFQQPVDLDRFTLTRTDTGERVPMQFSAIVRDTSGVKSATLNFCSDLPSGGRYEFVLSAANAPVAIPPQVKEIREGNTIVLDSGAMRVRIPASQQVHGDAPGPILQVSRGGAWVGSSVLSFDGDRIVRITTSSIEHGPLFIAYEIAYESAGGSRYVARVQCTAGFDFIRFQENMEGMKPGVHGAFTATWSGFPVTHRQAPNHPFPLPSVTRPYDAYDWERIDALFPLNPVALPDGQISFNLGIYQTWTAFHSDTSANFWSDKSGDALGVFIDKVAEWQDHEYANHTESETTQVRFYYQNDRFTWKWLLTRGSRSMCIAFYDHDKDKQAMQRLEQAAQPVEKDGVSYHGERNYTSHTMFLQNRYGTLDLNAVKDWILEYPESARRPPVIFETGSVKDADELERRVMTLEYVGTLPLTGTRENGGMGPIPGRGIVNFSPVPSRQIQGWWIDAFNRLAASMTERQRKRLTAMYLFIAYVHAGEDFMPLIPMLSGHPNFLAEVKGNPAAMAFLFPDHPMARTWADLWQKAVELNTRYNTRPQVKTWDAAGGRWTENLGTYVWAFLRPSLRTDFLLRKFDGVERFLSPQLAEMADWLVHTLSAPFEGETAQAYKDLQTLAYGHEWGAVAPGKGPQRVHPPQGAHSERRVPPRSLWYLGTCLQRYAPLVAEHAMWAARPTNQDMETQLNQPNAWDAMYRTPDNPGTKPQLRTRKFTGYGIVLRSAIDTPDELSIHLQQIDQGPNYRWGVADEGGCGAIYFFAAGKAYSFNGSEDVGDRADQDTDFCTSFGVFKNGEFRSIGMNVLSQPLYDLGTGQFAELRSRDGDTAYSWPEYVSRSLLLAGREYFIVNDRLMNESLVHRLSWFVRRGSELPTIKLLRGAVPGNKETQRTDIQTEATTGVWFDGVGDSMALVSHRKDIDATATPFGCRVHVDDIDDIIFNHHGGAHFAEGDAVFDGTAGLIRKTKAAVEFALFHGTRIGVAGFTFSTDDTDLGIGGKLVAGQPPQGEYFAPKPSSLRISAPALDSKSFFYVDGAALSAKHEQDTIVISLAAGHHHWELTDQSPVPIAPSVLRTENHAGGARVILAEVASVSQYRLELSKDSGATWTALPAQAQPAIELNGLLNGQKVHVRGVAINAQHESKPGPGYPLYVTDQPPAPPDGLHVDLSYGTATVSWGEILGVTEYRLFARLDGDSEFQLLYHGLEQSYRDKRPEFHGCNAAPGEDRTGHPPVIVQYYVTASNGNGESARSRIADTNPASWRNWDPRPGEPFRRVLSFTPDSPPSTSPWPRYYPE